MDPKSLKAGDVVWSSSVRRDVRRPPSFVAPIGEAVPWRGEVVSDVLDGYVMLEEVHVGRRFGVMVGELADSELAAWDKILNEALRRKEEAAQQVRIVQANIRDVYKRKAELGR